MKKTIAIPTRLMRDDLTQEEQAELDALTNAVYTDEELAEIQNEQANLSAQKLAEFLPAYRYQKEVGGISYNNSEIQTDRETRANWIAIQIKAMADQNFTIDWKQANEQFVTFNSTQAIDAANAVFAHVAKCFAVENNLKNSMQSFSTVEEIQSAFDAAYSSI